MSDVGKRIQFNDGSMYNALPSSESMKRYDMCHGIHGAARERKGIKHATIAARRRHDKQVIQDQLESE